MSKKTTLGLIGVIIILAGAFVAYKNQPEEISITPRIAEGYFLRNDIPLEENTFNFFIIENKDEMESILGYAKTMNNEITNINFDSEFMLVSSLSPTNIETKIITNSVKLIANNLHIDLGIIKSKELTYSTIPTNIIILPKQQYLDMYLEKNGTLIKKIAMGRRTLGSPSSFDDLKENYVGTFKGEVSENIKKLILKNDMTYELWETFGDKSKIPFKEEGIWTPSEDLAVIELMESKRYLQINDKNHLEFLDGESKRSDFELSFSLQRI